MPILLTNILNLLKKILFNNNNNSKRLFLIMTLFYCQNILTFELMMVFIFSLNISNTIVAFMYSGTLHSFHQLKAFNLIFIYLYMQISFFYS